MITKTNVQVQTQIDFIEQSILELLIKDSTCLLQELVESIIAGNFLSNRYLWQSLSEVVNDPNFILSATLNLLPLERVGAEQGKSGSKVMICYFTAEGIRGPSQPFILKYYRFINGRDKLRDENNNFCQIQKCLNKNAHRFSQPIRYHLYNNISFLWSPFIAARDSYNDNNLELGEYNLWKLLTYKGEQSFYKIPNNPFYDQFDVESAINKTYEILDELHKYNVTYKNKTYEDEYAWYLKDFDYWGKIWNYHWSADQEKVIDLNKEWYNPIFIYNEYKYLQHNFKHAAIHGDLHPRNIVFGYDKNPYIIDYGWSQQSAHIIKDYVLMECNLRFMILQPEISYIEAEALSSWLDTSENIRTTSEYINERVSLIKTLRRKAIISLGGEFDLVKDYLLPMFFVGIGLLKHISNIQNQLTAKLTMLYLAENIHAYFKE